jgi:hypothetical protein
MKHALWAAGAAIALVSAAPVSAITYVGTRAVGSASAQLSITTDDTLGVLNAANVTDWTIVLGSGADSATLTTANSEVLVAGTALFADATGLYFDFAGEGRFLFRTLNIVRPAYCMDSGIFSHCVNNEVQLENVSFQGNEVFVHRFRNELLATSAAVPEPDSWALMIGGLGMIGGAARRRARASVTYA